MDYRYSYALGLLFPALIWGIIFFCRKDQRKEMLIFSTIAGIFAPLLAYVHTKDWWHPQTLTGTAVGIEDILYAFFICGLSVSIYQFLFRKRYIEGTRKDKRILFLLIIGLGLFFPLSYLINSIVGFFIPAIATLAFILINRPDLTRYALLSGTAIVILSIPSYLIIEAITPGWIESTWFLENFHGFSLLKIPIEEFIWHFLAGASMSAVYKFWRGSHEQGSLGRDTSGIRENK